MGVYAGPEIVENGLVLALDAGNSKSYDSNENLLTYSEQFDNNTWWAKYNSTAVQTSEVSSIGTSLPYKITLTSQSNDFYQSILQGVTITTPGYYTFSIFVKAGTQSIVSIRESYSFGGGLEVNLTTKQISYSGYVISGGIQEYSNGWFRIYATYNFTSVSGPYYTVWDLYLGNNSASGLFCYAWGAQLEKSSTISPYYATTSSTKSRGTTLTDLSGRGNTGTLVNGVGYTSSNGGSLSFDGTNDYVSFPTGFISNLTNYTIDCWFYWSDNENWSRIFDFGTGTTVNMFFTPKNGATDTPRFAITTTSYFSEEQITSPNPILLNTWYNFTITFDGTVGNMYRNSIFDSTNSNMTLTPSSLGSTTSNYLGNSQYISDPYLNGRISNFKIYNKALTASEIQQNYNATKSRYGL